MPFHLSSPLSPDVLTSGCNLFTRRRWRCRWFFSSAVFVMSSLRIFSLGPFSWLPRGWLSPSLHPVISQLFRVYAVHVLHLHCPLSCRRRSGWLPLSPTPWRFLFSAKVSLMVCRVSFLCVLLVLGSYSFHDPLFFSPPCSLTVCVRPSACGYLPASFPRWPFFSLCPAVCLCGPASSSPCAPSHSVCLMSLSFLPSVFCLLCSSSFHPFAFRPSF